MHSLNTLLLLLLLISGCLLLLTNGTDYLMTVYDRCIIIILLFLPHLVTEKKLLSAKKYVSNLWLWETNRPDTLVIIWMLMNSGGEVITRVIRQLLCKVRMMWSVTVRLSVKMFSFYLSKVDERWPWIKIDSFTLCVIYIFLSFITSYHLNFINKL